MSLSFSIHVALYKFDITITLQSADDVGKLEQASHFVRLEGDGDTSGASMSALTLHLADLVGSPVDLVTHLTDDDRILRLGPAAERLELIHPFEKLFDLQSFLFQLVGTLLLQRVQLRQQVLGVPVDHPPQLLAPPQHRRLDDLHLSQEVRSLSSPLLLPGQTLARADGQQDEVVSYQSSEPCGRLLHIGTGV